MAVPDLPTPGPRSASGPGRGRHRQRRARHRRHDVRVVRRPDREEAEPAGRCHRRRQLRDREGDGDLPRHRTTGRADRRGGTDRLHRDGAASGRRAIRRVDRSDRRPTSVTPSWRPCGSGSSSAPCCRCRWCSWPWSRPGSSRTGSGCRSPWPRRWSSGVAGRSTAPPGSTCGTAPPPWTPWCRWARWPRSGGRSSPCSSGRRGCPA